MTPDRGDAMANALDVFREQQDAARQMHAQLVEVAVLIERLQAQIAGIANDRDLREVLREERLWLEAAKRATDDVRRWHEEEARRYLAWDRLPMDYSARLRAVVCGGCRHGLWLDGQAVCDRARGAPATRRARADRRAAHEHDDAGRAAPARCAHEMEASFTMSTPSHCRCC